MSEQTYFEDLPASVQNLVRATLLSTFEDASIPDTYPHGEDSVKSIECHRRDGFVPFAHNRGGLLVRGFSDLIGVFGSGYYPKHKKAAAEINRQIDDAFKSVAEAVFERHAAVLTSKQLTATDCSYHRIVELAAKDPALKPVAREIEDLESDHLSGDVNSVMYELRVMYHGCKRGIHRASISAAVNTEGPYHRTHISWAPGVFCEGSKEVEITWRTQGGLTRKLNAALREVAGAVWG